jgi:beta-glucosidase
MRKLLKSLAFLFLISVAFGQAPSPSTPELERKVNAILGKMTVEQKIDLLGGINTFDVRGFPELGLPLLQTADGPIGVRNDGPASVMAGGISLASTWDTALAEKVGTQIGKDARVKGKHFLLGPGVNIYRSSLNGRNFEYFGEDPFLGSRIAVSYIRGVQSQGVAATVKHFMGNNSEFDRHNTDSVIDERAMREIYLPIFEAAVKEGHVAAVMDSYNLTNGEHLTQNNRLNNEILKKEWGFQGILMSDWDATYDAVGAANGGLDLEMPSGKFLNRDKLLPAIKAGQVSEETINEKVRRILRTELEFGWPDRNQQDLSLGRFNQEGRKVALQAAQEGMVLLKNEGNVLPLSKDKIKTIAVIGPNAYPGVPVGGGSAQVVPFHAIGPLEGISNYLGATVNVTYTNGLISLGHATISTSFSLTADNNSLPGLNVEVFGNETLSGTAANTRIDQHLSLGEPFDISTIDFSEIDFANLMSFNSSSERWTGYYAPKAAGSFDIFVQQGGFSPSGFRMYLDGKLLFDNWDDQKFILAQTSVSLTAAPHKVVVEHHTSPGFGPPFIRMGIVAKGKWVDPAAEELARKADAVVVTVGFNPQSETEGWDRTFELPPGQNELIAAVAAKNKNTIVVINSGGGVDMTSWLGKVSGVIEAWYPGQEGGTALAEILFGDVNPSGHLAATFESQWEQNPTHDSYYPSEKGSNRVVYKEGIFVGYRGYEHNGTKPLFPFGYGLSYTTFKYSNIAIKGANPPLPPGFEVSFDATNTGSVAGAAVPQLYVSAENSGISRPPQELKGFMRVDLQPGETRRVQIPLPLRRSFAYYDVDKRTWISPGGIYDVLVGSSSSEIELKDKINFAGAVEVNVSRVGALEQQEIPTGVASAQQVPPHAVQRVRVSQGVMQGLIVHRAHLVYPSDAKAARVQGKVMLQVIIGKDGTVQSVRVVNSDSPLLEDAGIDAVKQWQYRPYILNGEPIEVETTATVTFSLAEQ